MEKTDKRYTLEQAAEVTGLTPALINDLIKEHGLIIPKNINGSLRISERMLQMIIALSNEEVSVMKTRLTKQQREIVGLKRQLKRRDEKIKSLTQKVESRERAITKVSIALRGLWYPKKYNKTEQQVEQVETINN
jgi:hypothetical protein